MTRQGLLASLALAAFPAIVDAHEPFSYRHLELHELVGFADRVVAGEIEELGEQTYRLRVDRVLYGTAKPILDVQRFENWTCAGRWAEYAVGQNVLLFLRESRAMGAGNEGDMPIVRGGAMIGYVVRGSRFVDRWAANSTISSWVELDEIESAIRAVRGAFQFEWTEDWKCEIERQATDEELARLRSSSGFAWTVLEGIERARKDPEQKEHESAEGRIASVKELGLDRFDDDDRDGRYWPTQVGARISVLEERDDVLGSRLISSGPMFGDALTILFSAGGEVVATIDRPESGLLFRSVAYGAADAVSADLGGDRHAGVLIGTPAAYHGVQKEHSGCLWLAHPGTEPTRPPTRIIDSSSHPELVDGCGFGRALAHLGDLDGDGTAEFAVSRRRDAAAPWYEEEEEKAPLEASIAIVSIDAEGLRHRSTLPAAAFGVSGPERGLSFASTLTGIGDVNWDGVPDLAIGDPHDHAAGPYAGTVWIAFLKPDGSLLAARRMGSDALNLRPGGEFGASLTAIGDVDRNGVPDLLVGGADELWVLLLRDQSGDVFRVRHHSIDALVPGCFQVRDVAAASEVTGIAVDEVYVSGLFGTRRPHDSRIHRLSIAANGTLFAP